MTHLRYSFQESPEKPIEEHEAWIDWANERVRRERTFSDGPVHVTRVLNGTVYEDHEEQRPVDEGFAIAALPTTHLFQWLTRFPDGDFREMPHEVEGRTGSGGTVGRSTRRIRTATSAAS
ncbi:MAG: hypothetical protein GEU80_04945 [Dehalococcoidia bacterium]|nr:hypothetical protein [Dehalococcoidia bacterium]